MVPFYVHAARSEPQRYRYRVGSNQYTTLMADDNFKFNIKVYLNTTPTTLLLYSPPSQTIPCNRFFQDGEFLRTLFSRIHFFIESLEEIIEAVTSDVRELFQVYGVASPSSSESQHRETPLWLEVTLFDTSLLTEESMQCFRMIPASNEAIQFLLKKSTVMKGDQCCPICLEDLDADADCRMMPCDHMYHQQCIVSWLQINHVCPVCRYSLPTLKN